MFVAPHPPRWEGREEQEGRASGEGTWESRERREKQPLKTSWRFESREYDDEEGEEQGVDRLRWRSEHCGVCDRRPRSGAATVAAASTRRRETRAESAGE